jgi:predicted nucleic acid-binding Zn ribbon protein
LRRAVTFGLNATLCRVSAGRQSATGEVKIRATGYDSDLAPGQEVPPLEPTINRTPFPPETARMPRRDPDDEFDDDFDDHDDAAWEDDPADDDLDDADTLPCPYCGAAIYDDAVRCPKCESYLSDEERTTTNRPRWIVATALVLLALLTLIALWH